MINIEKMQSMYISILIEMIDNLIIINFIFKNNLFS